jgi:hypothetical protein
MLSLRGFSLQEAHVMLLSWKVSPIDEKKSCQRDIFKVCKQLLAQQRISRHTMMIYLEFTSTSMTIICRSISICYSMPTSVVVH